MHDREDGQDRIQLDFKVSFTKCTRKSTCPASCPSLFNPMAQFGPEHLVHEFVGYTRYVLVGKVADSTSDGQFCHLTSLVEDYSSVVL